MLSLHAQLLSRGWLFTTPWTVTLQGSSVHGISQAKILEWVAISYSRGSSQPRDRTQVSYIAGRFFTTRNQKESEVTQSCLTLCDPMDCCLPGSSVHGILQARTLEWVAIPFPRGPSRPRDWTRVSWISCISRRILYLWATREALVLIPTNYLKCLYPCSQALKGSTYSSQPLFKNTLLKHSKLAILCT